MTPPAAAAASSAPARHPVRARSAPARSAPVRHPRRVSGPAASARPAPAFAPARRTAPRPRQPRPAPGVALRVVGALNDASNSALLDRLIRSRLWIGVLAFSLIGIVAMQLFVLELNNRVGHVLAREAALQRENTSLRVSDASASAGSVVEPAAAATGMTVAAPGSLRFVSVSSQDLGRAANALRTPVRTRAEGEATPVQTGEAGSTEAPTRTAGG